jgi:quercetin dioxygenase-like cupin family protein
MHPKDRLADPVQHVSLADAAARLRAEPHEAVAGHRQVALVRHGPVSLILFAFERDGALKEHRTDGAVTIHALTGRLTVTTAGSDVQLSAGELVSLAPNLLHSVHALESSEMLLTICRTAAPASE